MTQVRRNVVANFAATAWMAFLNIALVPLYVRFLGIEAFGLVGFFSTLQAALALFDLGLAPTISREMARYSALPDAQQDARDFARTVELVYWGVAVLVALAVMAVAPLIATHWLRAQSLSTGIVRTSVMLMGFVVAAHWPIAFYTGGVSGLQRQVILNVVNIVSTTVRYGGAAVIVWLHPGAVESFFEWQIMTGVLQAIALGALFWSLMPAGERPAASARLLLRVRRFAVGMSGIAVISLILTQADKVVLSRMLPLSEFGYYSLASLLAQSLLLFSSPLSKAVFPKFTQLVTLRDHAELERVFDTACQALAVGVLPTAAMLILFSREILQVWTRSSITASNTYMLVSLLTLGSAFLALQTVPYFLALAHGWTRLNFVLGVAAIIIVIPALIVAVHFLGALGGALAWIAINVGSTPIYIHLLMRRLLPGKELHWYLKNNLPALLGAAPAIIAGRLLIPADLSTAWLAVSLATIGVAALLGACVATPLVRKAMLRSMDISRSVGVA